MEQTNDYSHKLHLYLEGRLPADQVEELLSWLGTAEGERLANSISEDQWERIDQMISPIAAEKSSRMRQQLMLSVGGKKRRVHFLRTSFFRYAAAMVVVAVGAYIWLNRGESAQKPDSKNIAETTSQANQPGRNGAMLTLADGSSIVLDSLKDQLVATENGSKVVLTDGQLAYHPDANREQQITFNTLTTPKGRQFQLTLPDSSKVWLNAASSIKFPTSFAGKERRVEVSGEAYFDVKSNASMPFVVQTATTTVQVLGTSFNINAYEDEPVVSTTLVEGRVKVEAFNQSKLLIPGEQAIVTKAKTIQHTKGVDIDEMIAWKNGLFSFNGARIEQVMRQFSRWYNVEVRYEGAIPQHSFVGKFNRNYQLSEALEVLRASNVHFEIDKNTIVIKSKSPQNK